jgi:hypothetical protein
MSDDRAFYGTILAMFALFFGHPVVALCIFIIAVW